MTTSQEFQNIVDLIGSKDIGLMKLGIQLVQTMKCEDVFQIQYGRTITDFSAICDNVLFHIIDKMLSMQSSVIEQMFHKGLLFDEDDIFWIILFFPKIAKHLDTSVLNLADQKYLKGIYKFLKFPKQ
jgi:hypothetical protein